MVLLNISENNAENEVKRVFDLVQESSACHLKYVQILKKALETQNDKVWKQFITCLKIALLTNYKVKNVYMDRILKFLTTLCNTFKIKSENGEMGEHPVLTKIIKFLLQSLSSVNESVRYWSCVLIKNLLENWEDLSEDVYTEIRDALLERLMDPKSGIRLEAIMVLYHFQDPTDKEDPVTYYLNKMIDNDFNASVRQRCIDKIALTKHVLPSILNRSRDTDVNVRLAAFKKMISIASHLTITQRRLILQCGFLDSSEKVTNFVSTVLLEHWLETFENDFYALMKSMRLDACDEDIKKTTFLVEKILNALFKSRSIADIANKIKLNSQKLIEYDDMNWETVLYYRISVQYLRQSHHFDEILDQILPELVVFCKHIRGFYDYIKHKEQHDILQFYFILEQMFIITQGYDVSDDVSRQCLNSLIHFMLQNAELSVDVAQVIIRNLEKTIPNIVNRSTFICEIISNIMYGDDVTDYEELHRKEIERKHEISQIKFEITSLFDEERRCISDKDFLKASEIRSEIENKEKVLKDLQTFQEKPEVTERKTDIPTIIRYLTVAEACLKSPSVKVLTPTLAMLSSETIQQALIHENSIVKTRAFTCYALCCIVDIKSARYGIHIFSAPIFSGHLMAQCDLDILIVSIKAVVDLLSIYGLNLVEKIDNEELSDSRRDDERKVFIGGTSLADLIEGLADLLEHENLEIQETAARGVCILLLDNRITSPSLVSRLIIKWANPATDNERLKQFIGYTLNSLPLLTNCNTYFSETIINTIKTIVYAPTSSPLNEINLEYIIKFMISLCHVSSEGAAIHADLAFKICSQMMDKPRAKVNLIYSKALLLLNLSSNEILNDLLNMCDQLRDKIHNNQIARNIVKFNSKLTEMMTKLNPIREE